jgi:hypothetical protein
MNTPLLSSQAILGNVGSCTSQSISTETGRNWFKKEIMNTINNSCTGNVQEFHTWELSNFSEMILVITTLMVIIGIVLGIAVFVDYWVNK